MIRPHAADALRPLHVDDPERRRQIEEEAQGLPSLLLSSAAAANAVMLGAGYFTPLTGYMGREDSLSVADGMRTTDGTFWPVPIVNLIQDADALSGAGRIALRDPNVEGHPVIAVQTVEAVETLTEAEIAHVTEKVFGTTDDAHPGVATFAALGRTLVINNMIRGRMVTKEKGEASYPRELWTPVLQRGLGHRGLKAAGSTLDGAGRRCWLRRCSYEQRSGEQQAHEPSSGPLGNTDKRPTRQH